MNVVVLFSGGVDSTTLCYDLSRHQKVFALSFDYGQDHRHRELTAAEKLAGDNPHWDWKLMTLPYEPFRGSALTGAPTASPVVPNRNMVFLSIAAAYAMQVNAPAIAMAFLKDDATVFPDAREEFLSRLDQLILEFTGVHIERPYATLLKREVVEKARQLGVPLDLTWSCYRDDEHPCGRCIACQSRQEAGVPR
jgi:7-cyano-7-deazaguanine synthase